MEQAVRKSLNADLQKKRSKIAKLNRVIEKARTDIVVLRAEIEQIDRHLEEDL